MKDMPDRVELRLSDCFEKPEREEGEPCLECKALILNINGRPEPGTDAVNVTDWRVCIFYRRDSAVYERWLVIGGGD